jgi:hypothetical protein
LAFSSGILKQDGMALKTISYFLHHTGIQHVCNLLMDQRTKFQTTEEHLEGKKICWMQLALDQRAANLFRFQFICFLFDRVD